MRVTRVVAALALAAIAPALAQAPAANALGYPLSAVVSADPVDNTPHATDGTVLAIAIVGDTVYVGGTFTTVDNAGTSTHLPRKFLFAYDRDTGKVLESFKPAVDGAVETIAAAPNGSSIIIGGRFKAVNGVAQRSLAMLTPAGDRVPSFKAKTNGYVTKALVRGSRLVVGGRFSTVNTVARSNLAALDATTGGLDTAFNVPVTEGRTKTSGAVTTAAVQEMDASGSTLVIVGNFRRVGGVVRQQVATIDLAAGRVTGWYTNRYPNDVAGSPQAFKCAQVFDTQMRDVEFAPGGGYFVVVTTGGAPDRNVSSLCDTAARWENTSTVPPGGAVETWKNCTGGDTLYSTAVTNAAVYVGGHQRWLDNCGGKDFATPTAFAADGIGAIDPKSGLAIRNWNPGRTRGVGAEELLANVDGLYVGSDTERLGGEYHARLGMFPAT